MQKEDRYLRSWRKGEHSVSKRLEVNKLTMLRLKDSRRTHRNICVTISETSEWPSLTSSHGNKSSTVLLNTLERHLCATLHWCNVLHYWNAPWTLKIYNLLNILYYLRVRKTMQHWAHEHLKASYSITAPHSRWSNTWNWRISSCQIQTKAAQSQSQNTYSVFYRKHAVMLLV